MPIVIEKEQAELLESLSKAEKVQVLQWLVRDLGDDFPGIESRARQHGPQHPARTVPARRQRERPSQTRKDVLQSERRHQRYLGRECHLGRQRHLGR